jgi:hypothetical protein
MFPRCSRPDIAAEVTRVRAEMAEADRNLRRSVPVVRCPKGDVSSWLASHGEKDPERPETASGAATDATPTCQPLDLASRRTPLPCRRTGAT